MKCFYHSADLDGQCSAAIVKLFHPECTLVSINYGEPFPWDTIDRYETIYMVDFSLQPFEDMLRLNEHAELIWIDHHKSALDEAKGHKFHGLQRDGLGACALVWEFFDKEKKNPIPRGVQLLAEYDVWNHEDPDTLPFQYGLREENTDPHNDDLWTSIFCDPGAVLVGEICAQEKLILSHIEKSNAIKAKVLCFETEFEGLELLAANVGVTNSQFFDSLWDREKYDAMATFHWRPKQGCWMVSLYTDKEGIDLGAIAKKHGGGGHLQAAGFQSDELPFVLTKMRPNREDVPNM